ncbi:hypothetical protein GCM10027079_12910 [Sediminivirga luteola]|uniref:Uncharacterized protein n=1 Tax=Sediminivirga luteola TaxID=1774748 RepID=A0A8J2TTU0_9MICO|nr:hypothetical protein GCM10011333_00360 [Sediminivirga luteola]
MSGPGGNSPGPNTRLCTLGCRGLVECHRPNRTSARGTAGPYPVDLVMPSSGPYVAVLQARRATTYGLGDDVRPWRPERLPVPRPRPGAEAPAAQRWCGTGFSGPRP